MEINIYVLDKYIHKFLQSGSSLILCPDDFIVRQFSRTKTFTTFFIIHTHKRKLVRLNRNCLLINNGNTRIFY